MSEPINLYTKMLQEYVTKLDFMDMLVDYYGEFARIPCPLLVALDNIEPINKADVVEVVRCKDCMYNDRGWCGSQEYGTRHVEGNDYCSYGERKDDND